MQLKKKMSKYFVIISLSLFAFLAVAVPVSAAYNYKDEYRSHWWTTKDLSEIHLTGYENDVTGELSNVDWYQITRGSATFCCQVLTRPSKFVATLKYSAGYNGALYVIGASFSI